MCLKNTTNTRHEPKGEKTHNQATSHMEKNGQNPNQTFSKWRQTPQAHSRWSQEVTSQTWAHLGLVTTTGSPRAQFWHGGTINDMHGSAGYIRGIFPLNRPLEHYIRRRAPSFQHHTKAIAPHFEHHSKGLGPR
jgi:hypothetical protein